MYLHSVYWTTIPSIAIISVHQYGQQSWQVTGDRWHLTHDNWFVWENQCLPYAGFFLSHTNFRYRVDKKNGRLNLWNTLNPAMFSPPHMMQTGPKNLFCQQEPVFLGSPEAILAVTKAVVFCNKLSQKWPGYHSKTVTAWIMNLCSHQIPKHSTF